MNTSTAALQAGVAVVTIRTWCRCGAVDAVKHAGRWVIDTASLAARIAIGRRKDKRMTDKPWSPEHPQAGLFDEALDAGVPVARITEMFDAAYFTHGWTLSGREQDRVRTLASRYAADQRTRTALLNEIAFIGQRFGRDPKQQRENADRRMDNAALRDHIQKCRAYANRHGIDLTRRNADAVAASPRQVDYILALLAQRRRDGDDSGFYQGPTKRADIEQMSSRDASTYITSLKGDY